MVNKLEKKVYRNYCKQIGGKGKRNYGKQILKNQQESKCMILLSILLLAFGIWWMLLLKTTF